MWKKKKKKTSIKSLKRKNIYIIKGKKKEKKNNNGQRPLESNHHDTSAATGWAKTMSISLSFFHSLPQPLLLPLPLSSSLSLSLWNSNGRDSLFESSNANPNLMYSFLLFLFLQAPFHPQRIPRFHTNSQATSLPNKPPKNKARPSSIPVPEISHPSFSRFSLRPHRRRRSHFLRCLRLLPQSL